MKRKYVRLGAGSLIFQHDAGWWMRQKQIETNHEAITKARDIVFLVRDPRDIVVSAWFERTKRTPERRIVRHYCRYPLDEYITEQRGLEDVIDYMNRWTSWWQMRENIHMVFYEDLHRDCVWALRRVFDFLKFDVADESLAFAVQQCEFSKMQDKERAGGFLKKVRDANDTETFKCRRGVIGGYVDHVSPKTALFMDKMVAEKLDAAYGYE
jgi:hypothetical protein